MKATTHECLVDLLRRKPPNMIYKLADALKTTTQSVRRWVREGGKGSVGMPNGIIMVRLRNVLRLFGYEVTEYDCINPALIAVGECITFGAISEAEVRAELGLKDENSFMRYFRGEHNFDHQVHKLWQIAERTMVKLPEQKKKVRDFLREYDPVPDSKLAMSKDVPTRKNLALPPSLAFNASTAKKNGAAVGNLNEDELIREFSGVCARVRELGAQLLNGSVDGRKSLRRYMNKNQQQELHNTYRVLHQLLKERRTDEVSDSR